MIFELIENERRTNDEPHTYIEERRKPVNIINEANRIALAGSATCGNCEDAPMSDFERNEKDKAIKNAIIEYYRKTYRCEQNKTDFAKALVIRNAAVLLDELLESDNLIDKLQTLGIIYEEAQAIVNTLRTIAEELAGSRVLELYGQEVE